MHYQSLLERSVLAFNFFPSRTLHPSQQVQFDSMPFLQAIEAAPAQENLWHRHWSRHILRQVGLEDQWVTDLTNPLLPLAMLSPQALAQHARKLGVVLCRPRVRRTIAGDKVRALRALLGPAVFQWIDEGSEDDLGENIEGLRVASGSGADSAANLMVDPAADSAIDGLGWAVLQTSFSQADAAILGRVRLKWPVALSSAASASRVSFSSALSSALSIRPLNSQDAMTLALQALNH